MSTSQKPNISGVIESADVDSSSVDAGENMKSRRKAREAALQALYQCDALEDCSRPTIELFFSNFYPETGSDSAEEPEHGHIDHPEHREFALSLVTAVVTHQTEIDLLITSVSKNWSLPRMARVDRNILRLAAAELLFFPEVPVGVTLNEAIELAKLYGTDDTPQFVNGILDQLARSAHAADKKVAVAEKR